MNPKIMMTIEISNETDYQYDESLETQIEEVVKTALELEALELSGEVSILFVDNERIKTLNASYRDKDVATDVLSFPQYESIKNDGLPNGYIYLGDIVISLEKAEEQSREFGHSFEREVLYLTAHSIFHLLGYDHMTESDKLEMRSKEKNLFKHLEIFK